MSVPRSRRCTWGGKTASKVGFPPHLLDELACVYARAAVEALLAEPREKDIEPSPEAKNSAPSDDGRRSEDAPG